MENKIKIKLKEPDQSLQNTYLCSVSNDNKYNLQNIIYKILHAILKSP